MVIREPSPDVRDKQDPERDTEDAFLEDLARASKRTGDEPVKPALDDRSS